MQLKSSQSQGLLLFKLSALQSFALGTLKIQEIIPFQPLTQLPNAQADVIGAASFRGMTLSVIDIAAAVGFLQSQLKKEKIV